MIYIAIEHINGEIDKILNKIYNKQEAQELIKQGYLIIEININKREVKLID